MNKRLNLLWIIAAVAILGIMVPACDTDPDVYWDITWELNGGNWRATMTTAPAAQVKDGAVLARPSPNPAKEGYNFGGWFSNEALTTQVSFSQTVTADLTLYARWNVGLPSADPVYLGFSADIHFYEVDSPFWPPNTSGYTESSIYKPWMEQLKTKNGITHLDYVAFLGDLGSTDVNTGNPNGEMIGRDRYWLNSVWPFMLITDEFVESGFILNEPIFLTGNHEWLGQGGGA